MPRYCHKTQNIYSCFDESAFDSEIAPSIKSVITWLIWTIPQFQLLTTCQQLICAFFFKARQIPRRKCSTLWSVPSVSMPEAFLTLNCSAKLPLYNSFGLWLRNAVSGKPKRWSRWWNRSLPHSGQRTPLRLDDYIKKQSLLFPGRGISRLCALSIRLVA